jgi:hypothetical protein
LEDFLMKIFAKVYVDVYTHPKFIAAGYEASGYWMHALAYLRHHESSDGFLSDGLITVPLSGGRAKCRKLCETLVSTGLFHRVEGGYLLAHYAEKNETKADIVAAKSASRERKAKSRYGAGDPPPDIPDPPKESETEDVVTRDTVDAVTRDGVEMVTRSDTADERAPSQSRSCLCLCLSSCVCPSRASGLSPEQPQAARDPERPEGGVQRGDPQKAPTTLAPRRPLPPSERALNGPHWLAAFIEGIKKQTGRPYTAGRKYDWTLERIVANHLPKRDAPSACAFLRDEASAFAKQWEGRSPTGGLNPDGLEQWLNGGRHGPPMFGKPKIVQLPAAEWKPDDWSDLGATVIKGSSGTDGKGRKHE